jgi:hypothetical protein
MRSSAILKAISYLLYPISHLLLAISHPLYARLSRRDFVDQLSVAVEFPPSNPELIRQWRVIAYIFHREIEHDECGGCRSD